MRQSAGGNADHATKLHAAVSALAPARLAATANSRWWVRHAAAQYSGTLTSDTSSHAPCRPRLSIRANANAATGAIMPPTARKPEPALAMAQRRSSRSPPNHSAALTNANKANCNTAGKLSQLKITSTSDDINSRNAPKKSSVWRVRRASNPAHTRSPHDGGGVTGAAGAASTRAAGAIGVATTGIAGTTGGAVADCMVMLATTGAGATEALVMAASTRNMGAASAGVSCPCATQRSTNCLTAESKTTSFAAATVRPQRTNQTITPTVNKHKNSRRVFKKKKSLMARRSSDRRSFLRQSTQAELYEPRERLPKTVSMAHIEQMHGWQHTCSLESSSMVCRAREKSLSFRCSRVYMVETGCG